MEKVIVKCHGTQAVKGKFYYTVKYNGEEELVELLPTQSKTKHPKELTCLVSIDGGRVKLVQDREWIMGNHYQPGREYDFNVRGEVQQGHKVIDQFGYAHIWNHPQSLHIKSGDAIKLKVKALNGINLEFEEYVTPEKGGGADFVELSSLISNTFPEDVREELESLCGQLLDNPVFEPARVAYDNQEKHWPLEFLVRLNIYLGSSEAEDDSRYATLFRSLSFHLLEQSVILKRLSSDERRQWIDTLTPIAQNAEDYWQASEINAKGQGEEYMNQVLDNLRTSEYLYQPERKFRVMLYLFRMRFDLMAKMLDSVCDILVAGNKNNWKNEPFRGGFVKMLEIFISTYRVTAIRNRGVKLIHQLIKAIAIQLLLSNDSDTIDRRLNRATYYRLLAYIDRYASDKLLHDALMCLLTPYNETLEYGWADVQNLNSLYLQAAYRRRPDASPDFQPWEFKSDNGVLWLDNNGVTIASENGGNEVKVSDICDWERLTVRLGTSKPKKSKGTTLESLSGFWDAIIEGMSEKPRVMPAQEEKEPTIPEPGAYTFVEAISEDAENTCFKCRISDKRYKGEGILEKNEIVSYLKGGRDNLLQTKDKFGRPLKLPVRVMGDPDADGQLRFSMVEDVLEWENKTQKAGATVEVRINDTNGIIPYGKNGYQRGYVGITFEGVPAFVREEDGKYPQKGDVITACIEELRPSGQVTCEYIGKSNAWFTAHDALGNLLRAVSRYYAEDEDESEEELPQAAVERKAVTEDMMLEIVGILDRYAVIHSDKRMAFSALAVARIISRLVGSKEGDEYYNRRCRLLIDFEKYEQSGIIDEHTLQALAQDMTSEAFKNDYLVNEAFSKFQILEAMGKRHNVEKLREISGSDHRPNIRNAANLAIAYILSWGQNIPEIDTRLRERIYQLLELNITISDDSDYGALETQTKEYKTSVVYPGNSMLPAKDVQGAVIMQVVDSMLNSDDGGTIYFGVDDNGMAVGLDNDLKYLELTRDGYDRYIRGWIYRELGQVANSLCNGSWESTRGCDVYRLDIKPAPELIPFRGDFWQRQGSEKHVLTKEDLPTIRQLHAQAMAKK